MFIGLYAPHVTQLYSVRMIDPLRRKYTDKPYLPPKYNNRDRSYICDAPVVEQYVKIENHNITVQTAWAYWFGLLFTTFNYS